MEVELIVTKFKTNCQRLQAECLNFVFIDMGTSHNNAAMPTYTAYEVMESRNSFLATVVKSTEWSTDNEHVLDNHYICY